MTYPGTNLPLAPGYPIDQLRAALLAGPGATDLYAGAISFLRMSQTLTKAAEDLEGTLGTLSEGLEGAAAAAATQHITALVENGQAGAAQATLAYNGLNEQGDYHIRARQDMQAVPEQPDPDQQHVLAVDSAARYQNNANHTLTDVFQAFVAPTATPIDVAPAATPHAAGWSGPPDVGAAHLAAGSGTSDGSGLAGAPAPVAPGAATAPTGVSSPGGGFPGGVGPGGSPRGTGGTGSGGTGSGGTGSGGTGSGSTGSGGTGSGGTGSGGTESRGTTIGSTTPGSTTPDAGGTPIGVAPQRTSPAGDGNDPGGRNSPAGTPDEQTSRPRIPGPPDRTGAGGQPSAPWTPTGPPSQSWRNSQPWGTGERSPTGETPAGRGTWRSGPSSPAEPGSGRSTGGGRAAPPAEPSAGDPASNTRAGQPGTGQGMAPMMGGGGRGQDDAHGRPRWLLLDDPQAFWFSGLPAHTSPVVDATDDDDPGRSNRR